VKVYGLTGGIGCGKSFVASVAEKYFPVRHINTDDIARQQMKKGGKSYEKVVEAFGCHCPELLDENGEINRPFLSKIVFGDKEKLELLDSITHPLVIDEIKEIISDKNTAEEYQAVLIETALVFESGIDKLCDEVWYVYCPLSERRKRLEKSRGYSREKTDSVLKGQLDEDEFLKRCDRVILNSDAVSVEDMVHTLSELFMQ